jgi:hypothetical protein
MKLYGKIRVMGLNSDQGNGKFGKGGKEMIFRLYTLKSRDEVTMCARVGSLGKNSFRILVTN